MPINKDALKRYRVIDELLSDPNHDYTTDEINHKVNRVCEPVSLRMIQKDLKAIEEYFGKELARNAAGRGTVRYVDQSEPLFYKELTEDEEQVLREVLKTLGQFDGLDNFTWLDLLKKKLSFHMDASSTPYISFSKNEGLQIPRTLLGRLFTAISKKKVIRVTYTKFGDEAKVFTVYPYQLKQYNDRWFLLCTPLADENYPYREDFIMNLALDRMGEKLDYVEDEPYVETKEDLQARFDEIIGVTFEPEKDVEDIVFAVRPSSTPYIRTKWLHSTQIEFDKESLSLYRQKYPSLRDCAFFSIACCENPELYNLVSSYGENLVLVEPKYMRDHMAERMREAAENYSNLK